MELQRDMKVECEKHGEVERRRRKRAGDRKKKRAEERRGESSRAQLERSRRDRVGWREEIMISRRRETNERWKKERKRQRNRSGSCTLIRVQITGGITSCLLSVIYPRGLINIKYLFAVRPDLQA